MKSIDLKVLEALEACHVVVGLSPTGVIIRRCEVLEAIHNVDSVREEDIIVDKHLTLLCLIWVQWCQVSFNNSHGSLSCCFKEVIVNLLHCSISLSALSHVIFWEILDDLILFIPVSNSSWVKSIEWADNLAEFVLGADLVWFFLFK